VQVAVLSISEKFNGYAQEVVDALKNDNIRVEPNLGADKIGAKIRNAAMEKIPYSVIIGEKEAAFRNLVSGQIQPLPGLMTLLALADRASIPMVAVTNAPRLNAEMLLSGLGIMNRFKAIVIGDELAHGKPHPMPYLEGLRAVSAAADLSLAFEDSRSGIQSASAAGIATIGIRTSLSHGDMVAAGAVMTASAFDDLELVKLVGTAMNW